jgi:hypothetical protein
MAIRLCIFFWNQKHIKQIVNNSPEKMVIKNSIYSKRISSTFKVSLIILTFIIYTIPGVPTTSMKATRYEYKELGMDIAARKAYYLNHASTYSDKNSQIIKTYLGLDVNPGKIVDRLSRIYNSGAGDFIMNYVLRIYYLDKFSNVLDNETRLAIINALFEAKFWFTENNSKPGDIYWTENHQINYHTAELLAGQLLKEEIFPLSNMTGQDHINHALPLIERWIMWKAQYGFSEWHSNTYMGLNMIALLNLADFAENSTISAKAKMLLDLICFEFACNWYEDRYATAHARCYERTKIALNASNPSIEEEIGMGVWYLLGLGRFNAAQEIDLLASFAVTSTYQPNPILEKIAHASKNNIEHKDSNGFFISDGGKLGIPYDEEHLMFWWGTAATVNPWTINTSLEVIEKYQLDPGLVCGDGIPEVLSTGAKLRGLSISEYASLLQEITRGVCMERANVYTYRTSYYQLSGAQDYQKGLNGIQEHVWQASLTNNALVFTNAPGGVGFKGGFFMGGWKPRATFYRNVGIIQYDHNHTVFEGSIATAMMDIGLNLIGGNRPYNHAYFPRWAFDEVVSSSGWTFGCVNGSYVALYSSNPTYWVSNYELRAWGEKNCWIIELGSQEDYASFNDFQTRILANPLRIKSDSIGYTIKYDSSSVGPIAVQWEGEMLVNNSPVDIGPYNRWDNPYSVTPYGSLQTEISYQNETVLIDFDF